jgi:hypothetical protein
MKYVKNQFKEKENGCTPATSGFHQYMLKNEGRRFLRIFKDWDDQPIIGNWSRPLSQHYENKY